MNSTPVILLIAAALAGGCASYPVPELQLAAAQVAIERAAPGGREPLALAREKMALAQRLSDGGANQAARWAAEQAEVDAELASATAVAVLAVAESVRVRMAAR